MKLNGQQFAPAAALGHLSGYTWITQVNEVLQLIAYTVSIVLGIYAIQFYRKKKK